MRFVERLSKETIKILQRLEKESRYYQVRQRAKCILLSHQKYTVTELAQIFQVSNRTIFRWLNSWEKRGLTGLYDQKGRGKKPTFNQEQKEQIKVWVKENPNLLKKVQEKIKQEWNITISKDTIKRVIKSLKMSWHRVKKVVGGQPKNVDYEQKISELAELKEQEKTGKIDLRYVDETGLCWLPYVPYAWQEKGGKIKIKSQRSKRLNILGFYNKNNELDSYIFECAIDSNIIIYCIDKFSLSLKKDTVLVMDQASINTAKKIKNQEEKWKKQGLSIFFLPTYSPQLNLIEILWRFIKYQWLKPSDYESWETLVKAVENILQEIGK